MEENELRGELHRVGQKASQQEKEVRELQRKVDAADGAMGSHTNTVQALQKNLDALKLEKVGHQGSLSAYISLSGCI